MKSNRESYLHWGSKIDIFHSFYMTLLTKNNSLSQCATQVYSLIFGAKIQIFSTLLSSPKTFIKSKMILLSDFHPQ